MYSAFNLGNAVSTWVLAALVVALFIAFGLTIKAWREARLSPYYFQRRQALHQMQSYSIASLITMMAALAVLAYAYSPETLTTPRTAVIANAKPLSPSAVRVSESVEAPQSVSFNQLAAQLTPSLPDQFSALTPQAELAASTRIGGVEFAMDITDEYEPVAVRNIFGEGDFTLYAVFDYADMTDGMQWSWVWRQNGEVVGGGEQLWAYGSEGPGWVYYQPEDGFVEGEYSLELWVNGEFMEKSDIEVSASIANQ